MNEEEIIKKYRLGPDSRVKFKGDPQQYWIRNISPDRKNVFVHINDAQTYRKLIKNIIQVDNKKLNEMKSYKGKLFDRDRGYAYIERDDKFHKVKVLYRDKKPPNQVTIEFNGKIETISPLDIFKNPMKNLKEEKSTSKKIWRNSKNQLHREDGPAVEWSDGTKEWYINGQLHREDGPAIEWSDGSKAWYINGQRTEPEKQKVSKNTSTTQGDLDINYNLKENIKKILKELNIRPSPGSIRSKDEQALKVIKSQLGELIDSIGKGQTRKELIAFFAENILGLIKQELGLEPKNIEEHLNKDEPAMAIAVLNQAIKEWQKWKVENPDKANHADNWIKFFETEKKKYSIKESKFDGDIKSSLEKIIQQVWSEKDLNKAKNIVTSYLNDSKIKDEDKKKMTQSIDKITTKGKLDYYLANSLLKYEGSGLSQLKSAELKESQKPKCQCQKH